MQHNNFSAGELARTSVGLQPTFDDTATRSILIVDDEPGFRMALARLLKTTGFEVLEANNAINALSLAALHCPRFAIIELGLHDYGGFEILAQLRKKLGCNIHTLGVSRETSTDFRVQAYDAGADDFMPRPIDCSELTKKLRAAHRMQVETQNAIKARTHAERLALLNAEASSLLAHDINNGLTGALGTIELLCDARRGDRDDLDALGWIATALRRISVLTANFVDVVRFEDGVLTPRRTLVDIASLCHSIATIHDPRWLNRDKLIVVDCQPQVLARVDGVLLERILHNLVGNAVRYTFEEGVIDLRISVQPHTRGNELVIAVSNTGPNIHDQLLPELFEKYRTGADGKAMRGMGLYFCRIATEAHGGRISATSSQNKTSFVLQFPDALQD